MTDVTTASETAELVPLRGWGNAPGSVARVTRVGSQDVLARSVRSAAADGDAVLARGLGRAYGDAAQCAGGVVLDCTGLDQVIDADFTTGTLRLEAGVSFDALLSLAVPNGWFLPVTPGTRYVTIGGAIASDVHGKNHHRDGGFGTYVSHLALETATGRIDVGPHDRPEAFWATVGGMGLTGVIAEATVQMIPIETSSMLVDTERCADLEETMAKLAEGDDRYRYSVAWVDCLAGGARLGRSVLSRGEHAAASDLPAERRDHALAYGPKQLGRVPFAPPYNAVVPLAVRLANEAWFRKAPKRRTDELIPLASFFYPLDALGDWNRLYGPRGFTQYQFVVPFGAESTVRRVIERLQSARVASSLAVLKRFGASDPAPLSFPMPGWTLALDLSLARPVIAPLLDELDGLVDDAGGRVYLAKDGRLDPGRFASMYPRLEEWRNARSAIDTDAPFTSDLWRRLGVSPARA